jgi:hypothetical protein
MSEAACSQSTGSNINRNKSTVVNLLDYRAERSECALKPNAYDINSTPLCTTDCMEGSLCEADQEISPLALSMEQEV